MSSTDCLKIADLEKERQSLLGEVKKAKQTLQTNLLTSGITDFRSYMSSTGFEVKKVTDHKSQWIAKKRDKSVIFQLFKPSEFPFTFLTFGIMILTCEKIQERHLVHLKRILVPMSLPENDADSKGQSLYLEKNMGELRAELAELEASQVEYVVNKNWDSDSEKGNLSTESHPNLSQALVEIFQ
jgi:hypothetical protein